MTPFLKKISAHKFLTGIILLTLAGGGYYGYQWLSGTEAATRYMTTAAEKGTLIVSVSGTGQVSALNQIDMKPRASGEVTYIGVKDGQEVRAGTTIVRLDARDAEKTVRDAQVSLESARLSMEKLKQPADALSLLQAENSLAQAYESKKQASDDITKTYEDGFNTVANAFLDLPTAMAGLQDIIYGTAFGGGQWNIDYYANAISGHEEEVVKFRADSIEKYQNARKQYDRNFLDYKSASRFSDTTTIEALIDETYTTTKSIAEAVKSISNFIQFYEDKLTEKNIKPHTLADTHLASLSTYTNKTNNHLLNIFQIKQTLQTKKDSVVSAERSIAEKTESLAQLKAGADPLDVQSQELSLAQRENALKDAQEKLSDYYIRAPFDGIITKLAAKVGDTAPSPMATLITAKKLAEISLNEVDVAKVKAGQKTTLTFDAIPELTISGEVANIDMIGAVSQGVVTYTVTIGFDTQDERVKSGMSVSAAIITDIKQDAILVPNSAIKTNNNTHSVEILVGGAPQAKQVVAGLTNDTVTEIVSGITEGEAVITQTITITTAQAQSSQSSSTLRIPGITGGSSGARMLR